LTVIVKVNVIVEILHRLLVDLYCFKLTWFSDKILGHNTHAGSYLEYWYVRIGIDGVGDAVGYGEVSEEMLPEMFFRTNFLQMRNILGVIEEL
jgi:hypothetical protein